MDSTCYDYHWLSEFVGSIVQDYLRKHAVWNSVFKDIGLSIVWADREHGHLPTLQRIYQHLPHEIHIGIIFEFCIQPPDQLNHLNVTVRIAEGKINVVFLLKTVTKQQLQFLVFFDEFRLLFVPSILLFSFPLKAQPVLVHLSILSQIICTS